MKFNLFIVLVLMFFSITNVSSHQDDDHDDDHDDSVKIVIPPIDTVYVEPSKDRLLNPGEKLVGSDFDRVILPYAIQRVGSNIYMIEVQMYYSTVVVGEDGVLVIDPLSGGRGNNLLNAISEITSKPVTHVMYSHSHIDHISDVGIFQKHAEENSYHLEIIGTKITKSEILKYKSKVPVPNKLLKTPLDKFKFGGHKIVVGTPAQGHTPDNSWIYFKNEKFLHFVDVVNPDHMEFERFGFPQEFFGYEKNLETMLKLHWNILNAGHGNIGSKRDVQLVVDFIADVKKYTAQAMEATSFPALITPASEGYKWIDDHKHAVADTVVEQLRPKWGDFVGFDTVASSQVQVVYWELFCR